MITAIIQISTIIVEVEGLGVVISDVEFIPLRCVPLGFVPEE